MSYSSKPSLEGVTVNGAHRLARRQPLELRDADLDHEASAGLEVRGGVLEAGHLIVLRGQVVDRVVDQVGERELARHLGGGEVAQRDLDPVGAGLRPELLHHLAREVDAAHRHAAPGERQRDPAGADAELERSAVSGQPGQEVDGRLDHGRVEHLGAAVVVALGHALTEVVLALLAAHARTVPRRVPALHLPFPGRLSPSARWDRVAGRFTVSAPTRRNVLDRLGSQTCASACRVRRVRAAADCDGGRRDRPAGPHGPDRGLTHSPGPRAELEYGGRRKRRIPRLPRRHADRVDQLDQLYGHRPQDQRHLQLHGQGGGRRQQAVRRIGGRQRELRHPRAQGRRCDHGGDADRDGAVADLGRRHGHRRFRPAAVRGVPRRPVARLHGDGVVP